MSEIKQGCGMEQYNGYLLFISSSWMSLLEKLTSAEVSLLGSVYLSMYMVIQNRQMVLLPNKNAGITYSKNTCMWVGDEIY